MSAARLLAPAALAGVLLVPAGQAQAAGVDCSSTAVDGVPQATSDPSLPHELMGTAAAHEVFRRQGRDPGAGVAVAVVDSGVSPRATGIPVAGRHLAAGSPSIEDPHGTIVAGLIAGRPREDGGGLPVGMAWGARIVDVKVYDTGNPSDESEERVRVENVVAGLQWVAREARALDIRVVNVSLALAEDRRLTEVVRRLVRQEDVVVVAASGNRPTDPLDPLYADFGPDPEDGGSEGEGGPAGGPRPGEDARGRVHPAALPGVVAVSSTADGAGDPDPATAILRNGDIDVAVPTAGAVSYGADGATCLLPTIATSWAAAEVSGVVAMLRSAYPRETAAQIIARLVATATGTPEQRTVLTGAGIVQPLEALQRPLRPERDGGLVRTRPEDEGDLRATAPPPREDLLAETRSAAVWWGLLGGGALLLALVLRPVLARRRTP